MWYARNSIKFGLLDCSFVAARFPESFEDVVTMLAPELQHRGIYWLGYCDSTERIYISLRSYGGAQRVYIH
jgi:hypothetical protein